MPLHFNPLKLDSEIRIPRERVLKRNLHSVSEFLHREEINGVLKELRQKNKNVRRRGIRAVLSAAFQEEFFISPIKFRVQVMRLSMLRWDAPEECPIMISITGICVGINHRKRDGWEKGSEKAWKGIGSSFQNCW